MQIILTILIGYLLIKVTSYFCSWYEFNKSTYHKITNNNFRDVMNDKGLYGEYLIYQKLSHREKGGDKILFNLYIPKYKDNELTGETTEIDVLLISKNGLFVIESKNYGGSIYGDVNQYEWSQYLGRHRENFYNPVKQNENHIYSLKCLLEDKTIKKGVLTDTNSPIYSLIAFSDRCELKNIRNKKKTRSIICKRNRINYEIWDLSKETPNCLSQERVNQFDELLFPFSQVNYDVKEKHIQNIKGKHWY